MIVHFYKNCTYFSFFQFKKFEKECETQIKCEELKVETNTSDLNLIDNVLQPATSSSIPVKSVEIKTEIFSDELLNVSHQNSLEHQVPVSVRNLNNHANDKSIVKSEMILQEDTQSATITNINQTSGNVELKDSQIKTLHSEESIKIKTELIFDDKLPNDLREIKVENNIEIKDIKQYLNFPNGSNLNVLTNTDQGVNNTMGKQDLKELNNIKMEPLSEDEDSNVRRKTVNTSAAMEDAKTIPMDSESMFTMVIICIYCSHFI